MLFIYSVLFYREGGIEMYSIDSSIAAIASVMMVVFWISLIFAIVMICCNWTIFKKAGRPGWAAIVPFYNVYVMFDIVYGNGILFLLCFIPFVNIVVLIKYRLDLAKVFGKGTGFGIGLVFLNIIFLFILAFGNGKYVEPVK